MPSIAVSPRGPRAFSDSLSSPTHSPSSNTPSAATAGARDAALMRFVHERQPFHAAHGSKGAAWGAVSHAMFTSMGVSWQPLVCRNRVTYLLDKYDRHRAGKTTSSSIAVLNPETLAILDEQLLLIAKNRVEAQLKAKQKAMENATAVIKNRDEKKAERERQQEAKTKMLMKERDEKRAAAVVAAAVRAREVSENKMTAVNTATVVAKRRKRKGVKTKEQKKATAAMFEALRHSREEYLNQLRVQTATEAAVEAKGETHSPSKKKMTGKSNEDLDLNLLRAVAKCSPFSQASKNVTEQLWVAVAERVMKYCNLKFTTTALRDRCEALIKDFEANDCKKSTFSSGVVVADEERLGLLRVIRKEHNRHAKSVSDRVAKSPVGSQVEKTDAAIEIEDEQEDEGDPQRNDDVEQWGFFEENRVEGHVDDSQPDEQVEESLVEDTQDDEEPEPSGHQGDAADVPDHEPLRSVVLPASSQASLSLRKRRRNDSAASLDADPAIGMDIEELHLDDNSLDWSESQDFTPRKHKQPRQEVMEQDEKMEELDAVAASEERVEVRRGSPPQLEKEKETPLHTVVELIHAERQERRLEFKAMLDLMLQQNRDHRIECQRERELRSREQTERQREMTALVGLMAKERKDRKLEMLTMHEAMNKDRDDRREEFKAMMALITTMAAPRSAT